MSGTDIEKEKLPPGNKCAYLSCGKTCRQDSNIHQYRLPKDEVRCQRWVINSVTVAANLHVANLLQITNFYVPRRATNQVEIDCKYDVEGGKLYDVKWYKDGQQFFRCAGDGTVQEYPVEGVMIRHLAFATVGSCPLTLIALTNKSAGEYRCEVSLDGPRFNMEFKSSRLDLLMPSRRIQDNPNEEPKGKGSVDAKVLRNIRHKKKARRKPLVKVVGTYS